MAHRSGDRRPRARAIAAQRRESADASLSRSRSRTSINEQEEEDENELQTLKTAKEHKRGQKPRPRPIDSMAASRASSTIARMATRRCMVYAGDEYTVEVEREDGEEPLGITLDEQLMIVRIQEETPMHKRAKIGDTLLAVNGRRSNNMDEIFSLIRFATPMCSLVLRRSPKHAVQRLPDAVERTIQRHHGYEYCMVEIEWRAGERKLGLHIKSWMSKVIVHRCEEGTIAGEHLQRLDVILMINMRRVANKGLAKQVILQSLETAGHVSLVIERPSSKEAVEFASSAVDDTAARLPYADIELPVDVRAILTRERARRRAHSDSGSIRGILVTEARSPVTTRGSSFLSPSKSEVRLKKRPTMVDIASDTPQSKKLRNVLGVEKRSS